MQRLRHVFSVAPLGFMLVCAGCLEPTPGSVGTTGPDPVTPDPTEQCTVTGIEVSADIAPLNGTGYPEYLPPIVDGGWVFTHQPGTNSTNSPSDSELVGFDSGTEEVVQLTANDVDELLIDARDGALLFEREDAAGTRLLVHSVDGVETVVDSTTDAGFARPWDWDYVSGTRRRVGADRAVWTPAPAQGDLMVWTKEGGVVTAYSSGDHAVGLPDLQGDVVAFSASQGVMKFVHAYRISTGELMEFEEFEGYFVLPSAGSSRVFWSDGAFKSGSLADGATEVLHDGPCGLPSAFGERAVVVCSDDPAAPVATGPFWSAGTRLMLFDGEALRELPLPEHGVILAPTIAERWISWLSYSDWTGAGDQGTVWAGLVADEGFLTAGLGDIGSGCATCQVPTPPPVVSLSGNIAAWNYARLDNAGQPGGLAYAVLDAIEDCVDAPPQ